MGRSKLTPENKAEICRLSKEGYGTAALAKIFDVSQQTIYRVINPEYYAKTLEQATEYQRVNADRIRRHRNNSRRDYRLSFSLEKDAAIIEKLDKEENVNDYIRTLVSNDIKEGQQS